MATGKFPEVPAMADVTSLETSMSFIQIKSSISQHEKNRQVKPEICQSRQKTAIAHLEAIAGADNPLHPAADVRCSHIITKSWAMAYVTWCNRVEVVPRVSNTCKEEIPMVWNNTGLFVDLTSYVLK